MIFSKIPLSKSQTGIYAALLIFISEIKRGDLRENR
jgi:hypothetical protein